MSESNNRRNIALGAAIGVVAGFITGILTAPKSGQETRKDIKKKAVRVGSETERHLKSLYHEAAVISSKLASRAKKMTGKARHQVDELKDEADANVEQLGELLSTVRDGQADPDTVESAITQAEELKRSFDKSS